MGQIEIGDGERRASHGTTACERCNLNPCQPPESRPGPVLSTPPIVVKLLNIHMVAQMRGPLALIWARDAYLVSRLERYTAETSPSCMLHRDKGCTLSFFPTGHYITSIPG